jgi:hypothetical protein
MIVIMEFLNIDFWGERNSPTWRPLSNCIHISAHTEKATKNTDAANSAETIARITVLFTDPFIASFYMKTVNSTHKINI